MLPGEQKGKNVNINVLAKMLVISYRYRAILMSQGYKAAVINIFILTKLYSEFQVF